ncbi:MAG TPA: glycosyltransferase family 4 protein [Actinomycetota bacterium]|nr:glycosyltransferase family 4 protein [Actinomycetota bacterium]
MRIAVCHPQPPFMRGGAESHAEALVAALREAGHTAELVTMPFKWYPPDELVHQMGMWRSVDLTESNGEPIDMVIALKFPAYLVRHPNKVVWLIHQHRTAYELWSHPKFGDISRYPDGPAVRELIISADRLALREARRLFTNSENVNGRLERSIGLRGEVLSHRSGLADRLLAGEPRPPGDYLLYPSRFDKLKRQSLAIEAMAAVGSDVRLILVGSGAERDRLAKQIADAGLGGRVEMREAIPDEELIDLYLGALGVYFGPYDEDYGYIAIEGMAAGRAVIVTEDAGGPLEFVRPEETGLVVAPEPAAIAEAFDRLAGDRTAAAAFGAAGREAAGRLPDWAGVVRRLVD